MNLKIVKQWSQLDDFIFSFKQVCIPIMSQLLAVNQSEFSGQLLET